MADRAPAFAPVIKQVRVPLPPAAAFRLFTEGMGQWWPLETHSIAADTYEGRLKSDGVVFEPGEGGRIYELLSDGSEGVWGVVRLWEPPQRVAFSWKPNLGDGPYTEVEVRFAPAGDGTDVVLEHGAWERFGADAARRREGYEAGWPGVLELFRVAASA